MRSGIKRTILARIAAALGFGCGLIGLVAGLTNPTWELWSLGRFASGGFLTVAQNNARTPNRKPKDDAFQSPDCTPSIVTCPSLRL